MPAKATTTDENQPARASTRRKSVPPVPKPNGTVNGKKRSTDDASDRDPEPSPPRKRGKRAPSVSLTKSKSKAKLEVPVTVPRSRSTRSNLTASKSAASLRGPAPINVIPVHASHPRPARQVFIFGNGDFGQFGLGTDTLGEIARPRLHVWFETAVTSGVLGGDGAGVEAIYAGGMHTLAIDEAGKVWSWGVNDSAALGRPTTDVPDPDNEGQMLETEILETQPMVVQALENEAFRAIAVAAGDSISVALSDQGHLRAWGSFRSNEGLLGFDGYGNSPKQQFNPMPIPHLQKHEYVSVACGTDHVLALTTTGHVWVWGNGQQAQLGRRIIERRKINALVPERLALRKIVLIGTGSYHSFAVDTDGRVFAWGLNSMCQTGTGTVGDGGAHEPIVWQPTEVDSLSPDALGGGRRVVQISGGEHHTLFLISDGSVYTCGRCDGFETGLAEDHPLMRQIALTRKEAKVAAERSGAVYQPVDEYISTPTLLRFPPPPSEGETNPELAAYSEADSNAPPLNPISSVSAGTRHNLAVSQSGHVYSWGLGEQCVLGLGSDTEHQPTPTRVRSKALDNSGWKVERASAGGQHCVLLVSKTAAAADVASRA